MTLKNRIKTDTRILFNKTTTDNYTNKTVYRCELVDGAYVWVEYTGEYGMVDCVHPTDYGYKSIIHILTNKLRGIMPNGVEE